MATIALVVSIVALLAIASAGYTRREATAAEGSLTIERERRLEERRPRLTGMFFALGGGNAKQYGLRITLDSDEPLAGLDVTIRDGQGIEFKPRVYGVVAPRPGALALQAFSCDIAGEPVGLKPHGDHVGGRGSRGAPGARPP